MGDLSKKQLVIATQTPRLMALTTFDTGLTIPTATALAPVFLLLLAGALLRRSAFLEDAFWPSAERLTYYVLFPSLILTTLAKAEIDATLWPRMAVAISASIAVVVTLMLCLKPRISRSGPHFTSLLQGAIRMNTYVGLAVASIRYGPSGVALAAMAITVIVPLVNLVSIAALACYARGGAPTFSLVTRSIVGNPLIIATVLGVCLNLTGYGRFPALSPTVEGLGRAALPMGLLTVGASLRWETLRLVSFPEVIVTAIKLLGLPTLTAVLLSQIGVGGAPAAVAVLFTALPTAPSSYLLAQQMGGDSESMVSLITLQTAVAAVTLPAVLFLLA